MFKHVFTLLLALVLLCACAASTEQEGSESAPGVSGSASSEASVSEESFASDAGVGESAEESSVESVADSEDSVASSQPEESEEPNESSLPEESEEPVEPSQPEESEEPVEPSQPEESEEPNESSEEEPPETADVKYVAVDSLSATVLMLPCHTRDNLPTDFIMAMQNNPVDIDLWEAFAESEEWNPWSLLYDDFAALWDAEVQQAARDLIDVLGTQYEESVYKYVEDALSIGQAKYAYDSLFYLNPDGLWLGTYILLGINDNSIDVYRQTTFRLKYFTYLVETADGGTAERSLRFVHTAKAEGDGSHFAVITADDGFAVRAPYSPLYTTEYGTDFIKAMANNPIDTKGNATPDAFEAEVQYAATQLEQFIPESDRFEIHMQEYVTSYLDLIRCDASWFSVLHDLGYVSEDLRAQQETTGYRQLLFSLKYWIYVFETETENYMGEHESTGEPNLAFAFSQ